jgi:hypothetical protein
MLLGIGAKRGTWLYSIRLSLWMMVLGLGGAAGCSNTTQTGQPDGADTGWDTQDITTCYADMGNPDYNTDPDTADTEPDPGLPDTMCVECYVPPWEPPPEPPPDTSTDSDVESEDVEDEDEAG